MHRLPKKSNFCSKRNIFITTFDYSKTIPLQQQCSEQIIKVLFKYVVQYNANSSIIGFIGFLKISSTFQLPSTQYSSCPRQFAYKLVLNIQIINFMVTFLPFRTNFLCRLGFGAQTRMTFYFDVDSSDDFHAKFNISAANFMGRTTSHDL